jgi:hypothetical protein
MCVHSSLKVVWACGEGEREKERKDGDGLRKIEKERLKEIRRYV